MPIKTLYFGSKIGMTKISSLWLRAKSYFYTYLGCTRAWASAMMTSLKRCVSFSIAAMRLLCSYFRSDSPQRLTQSRSLFSTAAEQLIRVERE